MRPAPKRAANTDRPGPSSTSTPPPATPTAVQPIITSGSSSLRSPPAMSSNAPTWCGDAKHTRRSGRVLASFNQFYRDPQDGSYFSHIDYATFSPHSPSLGPNRSRKNWNSIGDHLPAYLVNLILALDPLPVGREDDLRDSATYASRC